jgi:membrane-associated phospholipid phosphatase
MSVSSGGEAVGQPSGTRSARSVQRVSPASIVPMALGLALVLPSAFIAASGDVPGWEQAVFRAINGLPEGMRPVFDSMQLLGVLGLPLIVALIALILRKWRLALALALLPPLKLLVERQVLKALVERGRPGQTEPVVVLRDVPEAGLSFPSGHTIIALGVATLLAPYLRRPWQIVVFAIAVLVCIARVYLGAHNPLDTIAGAGAGLFLGGLLTLIVGVRR